MPFNGSGTFTLVAGNPVAAGTTILASWANDTMTDLVTNGLSNAVTRDGQGKMTAQFSIINGTAASPGLAFTSETSTGLYRPGANQLGAAVSGTQRLLLTTSGASITGTLDVSGATTLASTLAVTGATTFTGAPSYASDPGSANVLTRKSYVDALAGNYVLKAGDTMTGPLGIGAAAADSHRLDVGGAATNGVIARFYGATVQSRGLSISSFANNATNGVAFRFDAPGAAGTQGALAFATNGTDRVFLDEAGFVLVNQADTYTTSGFSANLFQVAGVSGESGLTLSAWPGGAATSADIQALKSRGLGVGTRGLVASGDNLLQVVGAGDDGTNFIPAASISFNVDSTPGANDMPGRITFGTTADGASSVTERMRIDSAGDIGIGTVSPLSKLDVVGTISFNAGSAADPALRFRGDLNTGFYTPAADVLAISCGGAEAARISGTGIGVGGVAPQARLHTTGNSEGLRVQSDNGFVAFYNTAGGTRTGYFQMALTGGILNMELNQGWSFRTNNTARWELTSNGNLVPATTATYELGSSSVELATVYAIGMSRTSAGVLTINASNAGGSIDFRQGGASRADITSAGVLRYSGDEVGWRRLISGSVTTGSLSASDSGRCIYATGGVTIPNSTFANTDVVVVQNTTGSGITITKSITTAYNTSTGTTLGATFTLNARGRMSIVFTSGTVCYVTGDIT
jgi:hypothetical protein